MILAMGFIIFDNTLIPVEERIVDSDLNDVDTCLQRTTILDDRKPVCRGSSGLLLNSP